MNESFGVSSEMYDISKEKALDIAKQISEQYKVNIFVSKIKAPGTYDMLQQIADIWVLL